LQQHLWQQQLQWRELPWLLGLQQHLWQRQLQWRALPWLQQQQQQQQQQQLLLRRRLVHLQISLQLLQWWPQEIKRLYQCSLLRLLQSLLWPLLLSL